MRLAYQMAMENPLIQAESIAATDFYDLSMRYNVSSVPYTIINEEASLLLGVVPEDYMLHEIKRVVGSVS